jgi:FlaA1/EpsC-like NDP-sugar epimerase
LLSQLRRLIPIHKLVFAMHDIVIISMTLYLMLIHSRPTRFEEMAYRYFSSFGFLLVAMIFIFKFNNMYRYQVFLSIPRHIVILSKCILLSLTLHIYFAFFMKFPEVTLSRSFVLETYLILFIVLFITRVLLIPRFYLQTCKRRQAERKYACSRSGRKSQGKG